MKLDTPVRAHRTQKKGQPKNTKQNKKKTEPSLLVLESAVNSFGKAVLSKQQCHCRRKKVLGTKQRDIRHLLVVDSPRFLRP